MDDSTFEVVFTWKMNCVRIHTNIRRGFEYCFL